MNIITAAFFLFGGIVCLLASLSYAYADKRDNVDILIDYGSAIIFLIMAFGAWFVMVMGVAR